MEVRTSDDIAVTQKYRVITPNYLGSTVDSIEEYVGISNTDLGTKFYFQHMLITELTEEHILKLVTLLLP